MKAFRRFMHHLKEVDEGHRTVIMVQVENETGLLGDSRDRNEAANAAFEAPVPVSQIIIQSLPLEQTRQRQGTAP